MDDADKYILRQAIAAQLDYPSVYMGGPSRQSVQKAIRIVENLLAEYDVTPGAQPTADATQVREWRKSDWKSFERV